MAKLLDMNGDPIDLARLRREEAAPHLTGVRRVIGGHPADGLTPARLGHLLRAAEEGDAIGYLELAEQMEEKDLHYRAVLATRRNQVAGLEVAVEAASDDKDDIKAADLVREALWRDVLREEIFDLMDAIGKGFSVAEILWDTESGPWLPRGLAWRDPRWFAFDPADGTSLRLLGAGGKLEPLKPYGYVVHVARSKSGLPIRGGLARLVAWLYLFKNFDLRSWVQFAEGYGKPLRIGKYGPGASAADRDTLLDAVRNIWSDAAAIIPQSMQIDLVEAKITGQIDLFERLADWIDRQTSKAVLGQTGTTDTGSRVGTADAHERVRDDIEASDAAQLSATLTRDLAKPIVDLNLGPRRFYPRIRLHRPDREDVGLLVDHVQKMVPFGLKVQSSFMRDKLGIPDPDPGAELLSAPGAPALPAPEPKKGEKASLAAIDPKTEDTAARDAIDESADEILERQGWGLIDGTDIDRLGAAIGQAKSAEEAEAILRDFFATLDQSAAIETLAQMLFMARAAGEGGLLLHPSADPDR